MTVMPERTSLGQFKQRYPRDAALDAVKANDDKPFVTYTEISEELGCSPERARQLLNDLVDDDQLTKQKVGRGAVVYYPPDWIPEDQQERVSFFPDRREIMLDNPSQQTRERVSRFAHLVDSSGDGYLYKISTRDVWQAPFDSVGELIGELRSVTDDRSPRLEEKIRRDWEKAHTFWLETHENGFTTLRADTPDGMEIVQNDVSFGGQAIHKYLDDTAARVISGQETTVKRALYEAGYPVQDRRDLGEGANLRIDLADGLTLRDYQQQWVDNFMQTRNGVFAAPSGSGKTVAGIGVMEAVGAETLIIVPSQQVAAQWEREILEKTTLSSRHIGQYHGNEKNVRPVTIATYTIVTMERHYDLFDSREWGLIVYDECHHIAAEEWAKSADVAGKARLGLSATPVREAGNSDEIYTLIGPPIGTDWEALFRDGWIEKPDVEVVHLPWANEHSRERYGDAEGHEKRQAAATNPAKFDAIKGLLDSHEGQKTIIFVEWLDQGEEYGDRLDIPFISGKTPHDEREQYLEAFREGDLDSLILSRVGDEGIDLPNAEVIIIASSLGGSRAQHAQRVGRAMRPVGEATAYVLATAGTEEMDFARHGMQYLDGKGIPVSERKEAAD